jgi:hypothetical protein
MAGGSRFEVDDPRFGRERAEEPGYAPVVVVEQPPAKRGCLASCFIGCLIVSVVLLILGGIAAYWFMKNWRGWGASVVSTAIKQGIDGMDLPAQEKQEMGEQIDRVAVAFREGRLSQEQMKRLMHELMNSPLMTTFGAVAIEKKYIVNSGLTADEKTDARRTLRRYLRGAVDHKIDKKGMDAAMSHVADRQPDGNWKLRDRVRDEDLRAFLKEAKGQADAAQIPMEPEDVDPSEELKRIIDQAMSGRAAGGAPEAEAEPDGDDQAPMK